MNKKLFFAGFALLAAVSFTSCNSDNPIDVTDPNGVRPANSTHYLGGSYDWTAVAKDNAELTKFWNEDATKVGEAIKDKKSIDILLDVSGFELDGSTIALPDFWKNNGTGANGKIVNITISGNFKKADFERKNVIEKGAGNETLFPVKINTDQLKGAEVNFTFDAEAIDLELTSPLTRSTLSGDFKIGYLMAISAQKLSALEVKGGTVEGVEMIDDPATGNLGDIKENGGTIEGIWSKDGTYMMADNANGFALGDAGYVSVNNVWVENDVQIDHYYMSGGNPVATTLGTIRFAKKAVTITLEKEFKTEKIIGLDESKSKIQFAVASSKNLNNIGSIEKATVYGDVTLKQDVYTNVTFNDAVTFNTKDVATFDKVTFNTLTVKVGEDDTTLAFNGVNFKTKVGMRSGIILENKDAYTLYRYYQWVVSDADPSQGVWKMYKSDYAAEQAALTDDDKAIKAYNKDKEVVTISDDDYSMGGDGHIYSDKWPYGNADGVATNLVRIGVYYAAGEIQVIPEGTKLVFDADCTFYGEKSDKRLNSAFGNVTDLKNTWYDVTYGDKAYTWRRVQDSSTIVYWALVPVTAAE